MWLQKHLTGFLVLGIAEAVVETNVFKSISPVTCVFVSIRASHQLLALDTEEAVVETCGYKFTGSLSLA